MRSRRTSWETLESRHVLSGNPVLLEATSDMNWLAHGETPSPSAFVAELPLGISSFDQATIRIADFTGDGVDDIFGQLESGEWALQINDGARLYLFPWGNPPSAEAEVIDVGDFNEDGLNDVLSFDRTTGDIWVSMNSLEHGFTAEKWGMLSTRTNWTQLFVGDFNGDGLLDLLGGETGGNWWLARNANGFFQNLHWSRFPQYNWQDVVTGDFTGDGLPDVAARAGDSTWWVWEATDSRLNAARYWGHWRMRDTWQDVAAADFNNDGTTDLIGRSLDGRLWVATSTNQNFMTWSWGTGWINSAAWSDIQIVDMNGDGLLDQVGRARDNTWWYAASTGERFQNHFWLRNAGSGVVSTNFARAQTIDVRHAFPGFEGDAVNVSSTAVSVRLNEHSELVVVAQNEFLLGFEFKSPSGALVPPSVDAELFRLFPAVIRSSPELIVAGTLGAPVEINGELNTKIRWDPSVGVADLAVKWGGPLLEGEASVPSRLGAPPTHNNQANIDAYHQLKYGVRQDPDVTPQDDTPEEVTPVGEIAWAISRNRIVISAAGEDIRLLRISSAGGHLTPIHESRRLNHPLPLFVRNTPELIVLQAFGEQVRLDGTLDTGVIWTGNNISDLEITYASDAEGPFVANIAT